MTYKKSQLSSEKLAEIASAAAGAYALNVNPMPSIRGAYPGIHYYAGQVHDDFVVGGFLLCLHNWETRLGVEIHSTSVRAGVIPGPGEPGVRFEKGAPELYVRCRGGGVINWTDIVAEIVAEAEAPVLV